MKNNFVRQQCISFTKVTVKYGNQHKAEYKKLKSKSPNNNKCLRAETQKFK